MLDVMIKLDGLAALEQQLRELTGETSIAGAKVIRSALMSASLPMFRQMQSNAPVSKGPEPRTVKKRGGGSVEIRPGFLKSKVRRRSYINRRGFGNRNIQGNGLVKVRIGAFVPYAHYVELGTDYGPRHPFSTAPQPFVKPAFDSHWRGTVDRFGTLLEKRLLSARKRLNRS